MPRIKLSDIQAETLDDESESKPVQVRSRVQRKSNSNMARVSNSFGASLAKALQRFTVNISGNTTRGMSYKEAENITIPASAIVSRRVPKVIFKSKLPEKDAEDLTLILTTIAEWILRVFVDIISSPREKKEVTHVEAAQGQRLTPEQYMTLMQNMRNAQMQQQYKEQLQRRAQMEYPDEPEEVPTPQRNNGSETVAHDLVTHLIPPDPDNDISDIGANLVA